MSRSTKPHQIIYPTSISGRRNPWKDQQRLLPPEAANAPTETSVLKKRGWHRWPSGTVLEGFSARTPSGHKDILTLRKTQRKSQCGQHCNPVSTGRSLENFLWNSRHLENTCNTLGTNSSPTGSAMAPTTTLPAVPCRFVLGEGFPSPHYCRCSSVDLCMRLWKWDQ